MAEKRMFSRSLIISDLFFGMSTIAQLLYFILCLGADDDGFVSSPKATMRMCGATQENMDELIDNGYIIPFDSGIVVITHWKVNNNLRSDRYAMTKHITERAMLTMAPSGAYTMAKPGDPAIPTPGKGKSNDLDDTPGDVQSDGSKGKDAADPFAAFAGNNLELLAALNNFAAMRKDMKKSLTKPTKAALVDDLKKLSVNPTEQAAIINQSIAGGWASFFPLKNGYASSCGSPSQNALMYDYTD